MSAQLLDIVARSLLISGMATLLAALWSLPIAIAIGLYNFRGKHALRSFFNAMLGIPTVALGFILYLILSRRGPLGFLELLFTPTAIIIGQAILVTPIVVSLLSNALESVDPAIKDLAKTLGASERQASFAVLREARKGAILTIVAAFNRAVAELGIALMVGGNIAGLTRVMTTAIALETARGEFALSLQLTAVLLIIVFSLTFVMNLLRRD